MLVKISIHTITFYSNVIKLKILLRGKQKAERFRSAVSALFSLEPARLVKIYLISLERNSPEG